MRRQDAYATNGLGNRGAHPPPTLCGNSRNFPAPSLAKPEQLNSRGYLLAICGFDSAPWRHLPIHRCTWGKKSSKPDSWFRLLSYFFMPPEDPPSQSVFESAPSRVSFFRLQIRVCAARRTIEMKSESALRLNFKSRYYKSKMREWSN